MKQFLKYKITSILILGLVMMSFLGCKSTRAIASSGEASSDLSSKQLIKAHKKNDVNFKTLQAKAKIDITQDGQIKIKQTPFSDLNYQFQYHAPSHMPGNNLPGFSLVLD